jgi:hypothetical protein
MNLEEKKWFTNGHIWFTEDDCHASEAFVQRIGYKKVNGKWVRPDGTSAQATTQVRESARQASDRRISVEESQRKTAEALKVLDDPNFTF